MNYEVNPTTNSLTSSELYVGRTVCFHDVTTNPNLVGILVRSTDNALNGVWSATINNVKYTFDKNGNCLNVPENGTAANYKLYGIKTSVNLDITAANQITRSAGGASFTTTLSSLNPKDQFAICAMEALINTTPNAISIDDATILLLATKAYKIAEAMLYIGTLARGSDATSSGTQQDVPVDAANLNDNTQKILYNINETLKAMQNIVNDKPAGLKIATVSPTIHIDNPSGDEFDVSGGGGLFYEDVPLLSGAGNFLTHVLGFANDSENNKYLCKLTYSQEAALVWNTMRSATESLIDSRGSTNISSTGQWRQTIESIIDSRIVAKVKEEALITEEE